jgi:transketolase
MTRFGASAPGKVNLEKFGFTPENVAARGLEAMRGSR